MKLQYLLLVAAVLALDACASPNQAGNAAQEAMNAMPVETAPAQGKVAPIYWFLGDR